MALKRIKSEEGGATYHLISRITGDDRIFNTTSTDGPGAKEALQFTYYMEKVAEFHEITIMTWALLGNHCHLLVQQPHQRRTDISEAELIDKVRKLNGEKAGENLSVELSELRDEFGER